MANCPNNISLYWYRTELNFGDAFSPMVVRHILGQEVSPAGKWDGELVAEGSVLGFTLLRSGDFARAWLNRTFRRPLRVWGSGFLFPREKGVRKNLIRRPEFLALRGERTLSELRAMGLVGACDDLPLGDPGMFMPEVLKISADPVCRRGFVLHGVSWRNGEAERFAAEHPDIRLIDPRREPADVVKDIAGCAEIFSSSLHGLVAADALGIPNRWVELLTPHADAVANRFKFDDYYSAFGMKRTPCRASEVSTMAPEDPVPIDRIASCKSALSSVLRQAFAR